MDPFNPQPAPTSQTVYIAVKLMGDGVEILGVFSTLAGAQSMGEEVAIWPVQ